MSNKSSQNRLPGHLLTANEYAQLQARRNRGRGLEIISFIPVIIGLLLIIFVFSTNISSAFSWFAIKSQGRGGSSGTLFPVDTVSQDEVIRQELIARGMTNEDVNVFFADGLAFTSYEEAYVNEWEELTSSALAHDAQNLDASNNFFVAEAANILDAGETEKLIKGLSIVSDNEIANGSTATNTLESLITLFDTWGDADLTTENTTDETIYEALEDLNKEFNDLRSSDILEDPTLLVTPSALLASTTIRDTFDNANFKALDALYAQYGNSNAIIASDDFGTFLELSQQFSEDSIFDLLTEDTNKDALSDAERPLKRLLKNFESLQESFAEFSAIGNLESNSQDLLNSILSLEGLQPNSEIAQYAYAYNALSKASKLQQDIQKGLSNFNELENFGSDGTKITITEAASFLTSGRYRAKVMNYYRDNWRAVVSQRANNVSDTQINEVAQNFTLSDQNAIKGFLEWAPLYRYDRTVEGIAQARIDEHLINGREFSQFADRNRVERVYVPKGQEGTEAGWYWVVHTQRDEIVMDTLREPVPYFAGQSGEEHEKLLELSTPDDTNLYMNPQLDWSFLTRKNSQKALMAGFYNAIIGTLWVIGLVIIFSSLLGVGAALYLEEYAPKNWFSDFLEVNLRNLAGVPSIVYGILGLYIFVRALNLGQSVISAALTLTLLILPVVIIAAREAIRAVPDSLRQASYGLGATKWQTVSQAVLPNAIPGIVTGVILAVARAIGETAPLLLVGGAGFTAAVPGGWNALLDSFSVMPLQIYSFYSMPNRNDFLPAAAAGILVLLTILIIIYIAAFIIRARYARK